MRRWPWMIGFLIVSAGGCRSKDPELQDPEQLTLYSIDGRWNEEAGPANAVNTDCQSVKWEERETKRTYVPPEGVSVTESFHGYPVLGKVEVTDPQERKRLVAALKEGTGPEGTQGGCFCPRHAIRAVQKGRTFDYVICFQCHGVEEYVDGKRKPSRAFYNSVKPAFDQPLTDAGIPIAP
jgi:hypothetical protein